MRRLAVLVVGLWVGLLSSRFVTEANALPVVTDGLVAAYSFDGNINDSSFVANHGTAHGGVTFSPGLTGQSATFDGIDDYILIPANENLDFYTGAFSISFWLKTVSTRGVGVDERTGPCCSGPQEWGYGMSGGEGAGFGVQAAGVGGIGASSTASLLDNQWHMVTGVRQGASASFYVDGLLADQQIGALIDVGSSHPIWVGRRFVPPTTPGAEYHSEGSIDELLIYNRALSPSEVSTLYSAVPEPNTALLLGLGLVGMAARRRV